MKFIDFSYLIHYFTVFTGMLCSFENRCFCFYCCNFKDFSLLLFRVMSNCIAFYKTYYDFTYNYLETFANSQHFNFGLLLCIFIPVT